MAPRTYEGSGRRAAAEATRVRILEAARALIGGKGDLGRFSIDAVARRAGVARMTVYYQFRSRAGLLEALADHLAARGGMERMREVFAAPDVETGLDRLVATFVGFWASDRATLRRMRAMGVVFPTQDRAARDRDAWRRESIGQLLARHGIGGTRRSAAASPDLVDILAALTGFEMFDALSTGGRRPEAVVRLLTGLAREALRSSEGAP